ncbi:MAG: hypothetical protein A2Z14_04275 [Chloroflexi bacterium RBG_16_48_8]|nr:MAG: hypothetical protein A2Z14_04275 [Chloroflexi bacterium RBG_16_48_8]
MSVDIELRKAAAYISAGRNEAAHTLLSQYLKDFPDSDLAWLLLSYVVDDPRKQLASVSRALKLNPHNKQAQERISQLSEKTKEQSSERPYLNGEIPMDWLPPYTPSQPDSKERAYQHLSIEERLAFVTLEADSNRGYMPRNYPAESFYNGVAFDRDEARKVGKDRPIRLKHLLIGGASLIVLIVVVLVTMKFLSGSFISKADAQATARVETAIALATKEAKGRLPPTWTPTITPTFTNTPSPSTTPTPTASHTPELPNPTVSAQIEILQQQVSDLRKLSILENVNTYIIMRSNVRSLLEGYFTSIESSLDQIEDNKIILVALGLIDQKYDLLTNVLNSLVDSVGGFYLHETNQIFVIGYRFTAVEKFIYAHEFDHALIDQNFDLKGLNVYPHCDGDEDRCKAIQALVEGDATLLMTHWLAQIATSDEYDEILNYHPPNQVLPEQDPPPFAMRNSQFPYSEGLAFVDVLYARDGWSSVNQAFSNLPLNTEQILHPEKYLAGEEPINVPSVSLEGILDTKWRLVNENTLGEWMTYMVLGYCVNPLAQVGESEAVLASEGWGGDHYQVYAHEETGDTALVVHWKWDSSKDASQFTSVMRNYLERRFSNGNIAGLYGECWQGEDQVSCLYSVDRQNLWIVAPTMDILESLESQYPSFH